MKISTLFFLLISSFIFIHCANPSHIKKYNDSKQGIASTSTANTLMSISAEDGALPTKQPVNIKVEVVGNGFQKEYPFSQEFQEGTPIILAINDLPVNNELTFRVTISANNEVVFFGETVTTLKAGIDNTVDVRLLQNNFAIKATFTQKEFPPICAISGKILFAMGSDKPPMEIPLIYKAELKNNGASGVLILSEIVIKFNGTDYKIDKVEGPVAITGTNFQGDIDAVLPLGALKIPVTLKIKGTIEGKNMTHSMDFEIKDEQFKDLNGKLKAETAGECK